MEASYAREKTEILATANRKMEVLRWTVRMAKDRKLFTVAQFEFSARALNECGRMVGGWLKSRGGNGAERHGGTDCSSPNPSRNFQPPSPA